jgi:hypothetical protein
MILVSLIHYNTKDVVHSDGSKLSSNNFPANSYNSDYGKYFIAHQG